MSTLENRNLVLLIAEERRLKTTVDFLKYETPVQIIKNTVEMVEKETQKNLDNQIMQAIEKVGVVVDKEQLLSESELSEKECGEKEED